MGVMNGCGSPAVVDSRRCSLESRYSRDMYTAYGVLSRHIIQAPFLNVDDIDSRTKTTICDKYSARLQISSSYVGF